MHESRVRPPPIWEGCHVIADGEVFLMSRQSADFVRRAIWGKPAVGNDRRIDKTSVKGTAEGLRRPLQIERTGEIVPGLAAMQRRHLGRSKITRMSAEVISLRREQLCELFRRPVVCSKARNRCAMGQIGPECRHRWLRVPATTFVITHLLSRSNRRDGFGFSEERSGRATEQVQPQPSASGPSRMAGGICSRRGTADAKAAAASCLI
jgi:hypothetical protein